MINPNDISIIVQGPIYKEYINDVLKSLIKLFPKAEIILSTWQGADIPRNLPKKIIIIKSNVPNKIKVSSNPNIYDSFSPQIVSTLAGLKLATKKYALKIRSDSYLNNKSWLSDFNKYNKYNNNYHFLNNRVMVSNIFSVNPRKFPLPFHPCDWFFFGLKVDLVKIFNQPVMKISEANWFKGKKRPPYIFNWNSRYRNEQKIWVGAIKKKLVLNFNYQTHFSKSIVNKSEMILVNNLLIIDAKVLGIVCLKNPGFLKLDHSKGYFSSNYSNNDWIRLYKKHCDSNTNYKNCNMEFILRSVFWFFCNPVSAIKFIFLQIKLILKN